MYGHGQEQVERQLLAVVEVRDLGSGIEPGDPAGVGMADVPLVEQPDEGVRRLTGRCSTPRTISSSWPFCTSAPAAPPALPASFPAVPAARASSGSSRPSPRPAGPSTRASASGCRLRASVRNASTSGASGRPSAPSSTHWPVSTRNPASAACAEISLTRRVLPIPASPPTSAKAGSRACARPSSVVSNAISSRRSMNTGLITLVPISLPPSSRPAVIRTPPQRASRPDQ